MKIAAVVLLLSAAKMSYAEDDKLTLEVGADVVSSYVWRGMYQTGASIQPALSLSAYGFTLGAWGSTTLGTSFKEFDFTLSYEIGGLTVGVTDYWAHEEEVPYFKYKENHMFEGNISYSFGENFPLSLGWNTVFAGDVDLPTDTAGVAAGDRMYSSYFTVGYDFKVKDIECTAEIGINPFKSQYFDKFDVMSISLTASKKIAITSEYSLPIFAQLILAPAKNDAFLVFGITF